ncbi:unnamed protein product, partial [Symbiodinium sp. KB8]
AQRNLMNKLQNMFLALDTSGDGLLSWEEFNEAISSPKMAFWMSQLELESSDLKSLFTLLDGGDGLISVNEFMEGATRLRGPAKSIDVAKLLMLCTKTEKTLKGTQPKLKDHVCLAVAAVIREIGGKFYFMFQAEDPFESILVVSLAREMRNAEQAVKSSEEEQDTGHKTAQGMCTGITKGDRLLAGYAGTAERIHVYMYALVKVVYAQIRLRT